MSIDEHSDEQKATAKQFCGKREMVFYDKELQDAKVIHFGSGHVSENEPPALPAPSSRVVGA